MLVLRASWTRVSGIPEVYGRGPSVLTLEPRAKRPPRHGAAPQWPCNVYRLAPKRLSIHVQTSDSCVYFS